jgi:hypothetical protein
LISGQCWISETIWRSSCFQAEQPAGKFLGIFGRFVSARNPIARGLRRRLSETWPGNSICNRGRQASKRAPRSRGAFTAALAAGKKWTDRITVSFTSIIFTSCTPISFGIKPEWASATTIVRHDGPPTEPASGLKKIAEPSPAFTGEGSCSEGTVVAIR